MEESEDQSDTSAADMSNLNLGDSLQTPKLEAIMFIALLEVVTSEFRMFRAGSIIML